MTKGMWPLASRLVVSAILGASVIPQAALAYPPGVPPVTEIDECGTISIAGSYVLIANLSSAGDCLVVAANNVTINLNGYTISGSGAGSGITDSGVPRNGITIREGTVRSFADGVHLASSSRVRIEKVHAANNTSHGIWIGGPQAIVRDSMFFANDVGVEVSFSSEVMNNVAVANTTNGIQTSGGCTVIGNTSNFNGNGFAINAAGGTVVNNSALGNTGPGLSVRCPANVIGNTSVTGTALDGITLDQSGGAAACNNVNNVGAVTIVGAP